VETVATGCSHRNWNRDWDHPHTLLERWIMASRDNRQRRRPSKTRAIGYSFKSDSDLEEATDNFLEKEIERPGTPVSQFGTDGLILWVNGTPGPDLRSVIKQLKKIGWVTQSRNEFFGGELK
jgi:hypothetical protein